MQFNYVKQPGGNYLPQGRQDDSQDLNAPSSIRSEADIEKPFMSTGDIGTTVVEMPGQQDLLKAAQVAIRIGAKGIELATGMGGPAQPVGVESYGKEAREALRETARANEINFTSVHTPTQVGNMSGFNPQQQGFSDEMRKQALDEVKKAIVFAGDVAGGGAVVVHTGEFNRPISDAEWAKEKGPGGEARYKFLGYAEEPGRSFTYMVDDRTGKIQQEIRKSSIIREPKFTTAADMKREGKIVDATRPDGSPMKSDDWVTLDGRYVDPSNNEELFQRVPVWNREFTKFESEALAWEDVEKRTKWYNDRVSKEKALSPEEMAFRIEITNRILQNKGHSLFYANRYEEEIKARKKIKEALAYYVDVEKEVGEDEAWRLMKEDRIRSYVEPFLSVDRKMPSQLLKEALEQTDLSLKHIHEASAAADAQADQMQDMLDHAKRIESYALDQTTRSYAEVGIMAMEQTKNNPHAKRDIFIAPENIFPEQYGSHPEELRKIVEDSRKKMAEFLTIKQMPDPHARMDKFGTIKMVDNPYYQPGMSKEQAMKEATKHIKATFDTEHLALWRKNFTPRPGETTEDTNKRFEKWYVDEVKKLSEKDIIGHVHLVDSWDGGHTHLPAGQGKLPLVNIIKYLKKANKDLTVVSEGHSENRRFGIDRQLTSAWRAFGSNIRGMDSVFLQGGGFGAPYRWTDVEHSYFSQMQSPYFMFQPYAPSNDWTLWSQMPME